MLYGILWDFMVLYGIYGRHSKLFKMNSWWMGSNLLFGVSFCSFLRTSEDPSAEARPPGWHRHFPKNSKPPWVPLIPSTDFIREQFRLSAINGDENHDTSCSDGEDAARVVDWDRLREAVVAKIWSLRKTSAKEPVEALERKDLGFDDNNDFAVVSERVFSAHSQCGVGAGLGAYALDKMTRKKTAIATYSSSYYALNLKPRQDDGTWEGSQGQLDHDERALSLSHYRLMLPEVTLDGKIWRLVLDADPRSRHTRASLAAYQTAAATARKATSRVTVSAGCGARVNHNEHDANAECVFFTARGPSGKWYPLAGQLTHTHTHTHTHYTPKIWDVYGAFFLYCVSAISTPTTGEI